MPRDDRIRRSVCRGEQTIYPDSYRFEPAKVQSAVVFGARMLTPNCSSFEGNLDDIGYPATLSK